MNDITKISEILASLKASEKIQIEQFKRNLDKTNNLTQHQTQESEPQPQSETQKSEIQPQSETQHKQIILQKENNNIYATKEPKIPKRQITIKKIKKGTKNKIDIEKVNNINEETKKEIHIENQNDKKDIENENNINKETEKREIDIENEKETEKENDLEKVNNINEEIDIENENDIEIEKEIDIENENIETDIIEEQEAKLIDKDITEHITEQQQEQYIQEHHNIKKDIGFALFCCDHRFINNMNELLRRDPMIKSFQLFSLNGGSLGFLKDDYGCWAKTCTEHIELAVQFYNIKKIVVIDHEDCDVYKHYYKDLKKHPRREKKYHINNLTEIIEIFEKEFNLQIDTFILNLDGSFIKI